MDRSAPIPAVAVIAAFTPGTRAQEAAQPAVRNPAGMKFAPAPGLPTCAPGAVQSGDPAKGSSILVARIASGCIVPWHWHTANEHLMMASGTARLETMEGKPLTLRAGGYALMPSRHVHQLRCTSSCLMYVYSDAAFDIHHVDRQGKEIAPDEALQAVRETTVNEAK